MLALSLIPVLWLAYTLGIVLGFWQPVTRPKGVSPSARYVSLIEDGTWFDCSIDLDKDVNICKAWTWTGRLIADGEFRLENEGRAATKLELRPTLVQVTNGRASMIYLFGERGAFTKILVPISR